MTHKVRTTMQPDVELEVDNVEYLELQRQGVLGDQSDPTQAGQTRKTEESLGTQPAGKEAK